MKVLQDRISSLEEENGKEKEKFQGLQDEHDVSSTERGAN